jgi:acetyl-CoA C-acetyltransferase
MSRAVHVLGGVQSDFARHWQRDGSDLAGEMQSLVQAGLSACGLLGEKVQAAHIGNFAAELFCQQGLLGGLLARCDPAWAELPIMRHEAACASGSMAILAAMASIESGRAECVCVLGIEQMRTVSGAQAAQFLGCAAWQGHEGQDAQYLWPHLFAQIHQRYVEQHGLDDAYLRRIAEINLSNAKRNPLAQTRDWQLEAGHFSADDQLNPRIAGELRRRDCAQISDGAALLFVCSAEFAARHAQRLGRAQSYPAILGWGQRSLPLPLAEKLPSADAQGLMFPHLQRTINDALQRAGLQSAWQLDAIETHDCFTISEYLVLEHFGLAPAGQGWQLIEDGSIELAGRLPVNPSGGLIGAGHPVGASGVRMLLDAWRQVEGQAGEYQVAGARKVGCLNFGGSFSAVASFVLGAAEAR